MRVKYTFCYVDLDGMEDKDIYITEDDDEIEFLDNMADFSGRILQTLYEDPSKIKKNIGKYDLNVFVEAINELISLTDPICKKNGYKKIAPCSKLTGKVNIDVDNLYESILKVLDVACKKFRLSMGRYEHETFIDRDDITGCIEMTKKDLLELVEKRLGIKVTIIDDEYDY